MNRSHRATAGLLFALAGLAAGCGTPIDKTTPLLVNAYPDGAAPDSTGNLFISFGGQARTDCRQLTNAAQGLANGQPLQILSLGERARDQFGLPQGDCAGARFRGRVTPAVDGVDEVLVLDGAERVVDMRVGNLLAPRAVSLVAPQQGPFHPGDEVVLQWIPATDVLTFDDLATTLRFSDGGQAVGGDAYFTLISSAEGRITLQVKPDLKGALSGTLALAPRIAPRVLRCDGDYRNCQTEAAVAQPPTVQLALQGP